MNLDCETLIETVKVCVFDSKQYSLISDTSMSMIVAWIVLAFVIAVAIAYSVGIGKRQEIQIIDMKKARKDAEEQKNRKNDDGLGQIQHLSYWQKRTFTTKSGEEVEYTLEIWQEVQILSSGIIWRIVGRSNGRYEVKTKSGRYNVFSNQRRSNLKALPPYIQK